MDEQVGRVGEGWDLYRLTLLFILHADANKEGMILRRDDREEGGLNCL